MNFSDYITEIDKNGFKVINDIYTKQEIENIITVINNTDKTGEIFRKSKDLFAIRQFLKEVPQIRPLIFNTRLKNLVSGLFGDDYYSVKSIYFDKPGNSNWFVSYHQDLTISVDKKADIQNFGPWTVKQNQFAVQPPVSLLENIYTIRIHLDNTNENNGALKVIPKSHLKKIYRPESIDWNVEDEITCNVPQGGVMIMKPLLMHSSSRTIDNNSRRVIHIEFSNAELPYELNWAEKIAIY